MFVLSHMKTPAVQINTVSTNRYCLYKISTVNMNLYCQYKFVLSVQIFIDSLWTVQNNTGSIS